MSDGLLPEDAHRGKGSSVDAQRKHHYRSHDSSNRAVRVESSRHRN